MFFAKSDTPYGRVWTICCQTEIPGISRTLIMRGRAFHDTSAGKTRVAGNEWLVLPLISYFFGTSLGLREMEALRSVLWIPLIAWMTCFVLGEITGNVSQVDRIWSLLPIAYVWTLAGHGRRAAHRTLRQGFSGRRSVVLIPVPELFCRTGSVDRLLSVQRCGIRTLDQLEHQRVHSSGNPVPWQFEFQRGNQLWQISGVPALPTDRVKIFATQNQIRSSIQLLIRG